jgi:hypothetical protein
MSDRFISHCRRPATASDPSHFFPSSSKCHQQIYCAVIIL